jgi:aminomethyltransferase
VVTSGTFAPTLDVGIGMAYLPAAAAVVGNEFEIDVRGKHRRARVQKRPLLKV